MIVGPHSQDVMEVVCLCTMHASTQSLTTRQFKLGLYYKTEQVFLRTVACRAWIFFGVIGGDTWDIFRIYLNTSEVECGRTGC